MNAAWPVDSGLHALTSHPCGYLQSQRAIFNAAAPPARPRAATALAVPFPRVPSWPVGAAAPRLRRWSSWSGPCREYGTAGDGGLSDEYEMGHCNLDISSRQLSSSTWISFTRLVGRNRRSDAIKSPTPVCSGNRVIGMHSRRCVILLSFIFLYFLRGSLMFCHCR